MNESECNAVRCSDCNTIAVQVGKNLFYCRGCDKIIISDSKINI